MVSCFRRWAAPATAAVAAAAAAAISSHQQQQQQSKLDSIGLDFEQDKRGEDIKEDTGGFLVGFQKGRFGPREPVIAIDFASFSARNYRWCFAVSAVSRKRYVPVGFLHQQAPAAAAVKIRFNWIRFRAR